VASKNRDGWSCLHDAALCDDEWLLAALFLESERQVWRAVRQHEPRLVQALEQLPDFSAELFVEARSWVPLVSQALPSDTIRLWKRGAQLRCDMALKGLDGLTWKKGWLSHMFLGRGNNLVAASGHAVILDRDAKTFYDVNEAARATTVENVDLALQMMLTTAMSTSTMHTDDLEFVPTGRVSPTTSTSSSSSSESTPIAPTSGHTSRRRARQCPWGGTKYRMRNFSVSAQFRPVASPKRKMRTAASGSPTKDGDPLDELQEFVSHLTAAAKLVKKTGKKKNDDGDNDDESADESGAHTKSTEKRKKKKNGLFSRSRDESSLSEVSGGRSPSSSSQSRSVSNDSAGDRDDDLQVLRLPRGKKVEMHLDVCAGDIIEWNFTASTRDFRFSATHFFDDKQLPVCQTTRGVKHAAIAGQFQAEHHGSFVLLWMNTQPPRQLALDRRVVTIKYTVRHTRPMVASDAAATVTSHDDLSNIVRLSILGDGVPGAEDSTPASSASARTPTSLTDAEKLAFFQQRDLRALPNPLTSTVSFNEYFFPDGCADGNEKSADGHDGSNKSKSKVSGFFKRQAAAEPSTTSARELASAPAQETPSSGAFKNTFRSLTVLPAERRVAKEFEAKVVMAEEFPFHLRDFVPVMEFLATTGDHVKNLKEFFHMVRVASSLSVSAPWRV
jgi:hypothetical protein